MRFLSLGALAIAAAAANSLAAQTRPMATAALPAQASAVHSRLVAALQPTAKQWVDAEASSVAHGTLDGDAAAALVRSDASRRFANQLAGTDVDALVFIVMAQASKDMENDLRSMMDEVNKSNEQKQKLRQVQAARDSGKRKSDATSETSDATSMRLQMMMERRSKYLSTLSNIMKKMGDTQSTLVQNLK